MGLSYFRKSKFNLDETSKNLINLVKKNKWKVLTKLELPDNAGEMILICNSDLLKKLLRVDYNLLSLLPCSISILKKDNDVLIGTGKATILNALSENTEIERMVSETDKQIKDLINESAGVGEIKPVNVKLYSTMSCPYCKMEKTWLDQNNIKHSVVYVDLNPNEAEKMVKKTGQMGVPVTEIEYSDDDSEYIIGFDKERLAEVLF